MECIFDSDNCLYFDKHCVQFITASGKSEENYTIKIYLERERNESEQLKIILSNTNDESISYTSIITPLIYINMQKTQELHISFEQLAEELKSLLLNSKTQKVVIKFTDIGITNMELGFFTMTSVKEIKLLCISFTKTPLDDLVRYFKQKATVYEKRCDSLDEQLKQCYLNQESSTSKYQKEISDLHDYYKTENNFLKNAFDSYKMDLNNKLKTMSLETEQLKNKINILNGECKRYSTELNQRNVFVKELQDNNNELKNALKYLTIKNQQQVEKYDKIKKLFSSILVDFLKYQIYLKKIKSDSELQKEKNERLCDDIKTCVNYIMNSSQDVVLAKVISENKNVLETIGLLDDKIAQLKLENVDGND